MMGGLFYRSDGSPAKMTFEIIDGAYDLPRIIRRRRHLVKVLSEKSAYLIWDRLY